MKELFEKTRINQMELKNRFVRSATWEGLANPDGSCSGKITAIMEELARGQVGLIITSHAYINPKGQASLGQLGIYNRNLIESYKEMVEKVHQQGSKVILQISHAGGRGIHNNSIGPSDFNFQTYHCREMTLKEIAEVILDFKDAAIRARDAGFDGVQIHAAHGFLLSQFLSPFFNKRIDYYGGSLENRARIILEIIQAIRSELGNQFVVIIKINSDDYIDGGFKSEEMVQAAELFERAGLDAVEISGGTSIGKYSSSRIIKDGGKKEEIYYLDAAKLYKKRISIPLILVGGIRSYEVARKLIEEGIADYISLCRPLIREPNLVKRWKAGDTRRSTCISCNKCFVPIQAGKGFYCPLNNQV